MPGRGRRRAGPPVAARGDAKRKKRTAQPEARTRRRGARRPASASAGFNKSRCIPRWSPCFGPRFMWRTLKYEGDTNLSSYKNTAGQPPFTLALGAQYFPGAHISNRWYADLGADLDLDYAIGLKSKQRGKELRHHRLLAGLRAPSIAFLWATSSRAPGRLRQAGIRCRTCPKRPTCRAIDTARCASVSVTAFASSTGSLRRDVAYLLVLGTGELDEKSYGDDVPPIASEAGAAFLARFKEVTACGWRSTTAASPTTSRKRTNLVRPQLPTTAATAT